MEIPGRFLPFGKTLNRNSLMNHLRVFSRHTFSDEIPLRHVAYAYLMHIIVGKRKSATVISGVMNRSMNQ